MKSIAYYNGAVKPIDEILIPLSDRSIFFGDAIYDAAIGKNGRVYELDEHLSRLYGNLIKVGITPYCTRDDLEFTIKNLVNGFENAFFLYIQMSRTTPTRVHSATDSGTSLLITVKEMALSPITKRLKLVTVEDLRYFYCDIKTTNLLPAVLASTNAELAGCDEAVFHRDGIVTECAHSNIFILKSGILKTHPKSNRILPGITRERTIKCAKELGIPVEEEVFSVDDMLAADEIFVTSTSKFCLAVSVIDGVKVGGYAPELATALCNSVYFDFENL